MSAVLLLSNCASTKEAETIAEQLLQRKLAAAVQIIGPVTSLYRWHGKINQKQEWTLMIKTSDHQEEAITLLIKQLHSYELPGILKIDIAGGEPHYLQWITDNSQ
jgi:periplasmic divalent cation tolerance protein